MSLLKMIHFLSALIWVGGMFFAYVVLRPAVVEVLEPPQRLKLWENVFRRFFVWVWTAIAILLVSGFYMIYLYGGFSSVPKHVHTMLALGVVMVAIFGHVYFGCYKPLSRFVTSQNWKDAGVILGRIRKLISVNLALGILTVCLAVLGSH
ncbi:MAG: CopD family protein [Gallionella sp.]